MRENTQRKFIIFLRVNRVRVPKVLGASSKWPPRRGICENISSLKSLVFLQ